MKCNKTGVLLGILDTISIFVIGIVALIFIGYDELVLYWKSVLIYSIALVLVTAILRGLFGIDKVLWNYAGFWDFMKIIMLCLIIFALNALVLVITDLTLDKAMSAKMFIPYSWCALFSLMQVDAMILFRSFFRVHLFNKNGNTRSSINEDYERVMIIGAGSGADYIIREMKNSRFVKMVPICLIDDDASKSRSTLEGVPIVGTRNDIVSEAEKNNIDKIIIAIPSLSRVELAEIANICNQTNCKVQTIPGVYQLLNNGNGLLDKVRDVQVEDLLGREPISVNLEEITGYLTNQVVLVTGGGGSIGSELCRQIAKAKPKQLIIFDIYENNAYEIEQELKRTYQDELNLLVLIGSVRDKEKVDDVFKKYHPNLVFHAAAHKHVPLMEASPHEAIKNNVFGTLNVAKASDKYGVNKFVMISTDKAVNPTNIMGASKRLCEMVVQAMSSRSKTTFVSTRFGNVLGSNGSVIPLFKKQIANGGPVTVTHKDITRFFMTIPEAVSLVLQAGSYAKGSEIFVLDMGKPVKIYDLAYNLVKLSGYIPNENMEIRITGLRPGEKLYEEVLMKEEGMKSTPNKLIHIGHQIEFDEANFFNELDELKKACHDENSDIKSLVEKLVPTYHKYQDK